MSAEIIAKLQAMQSRPAVTSFDEWSRDVAKDAQYCIAKLNADRVELIECLRALRRASAVDPHRIRKLVSFEIAEEIYGDEDRTAPRN